MKFFAAFMALCCLMLGLSAPAQADRCRTLSECNVDVGSANVGASGATQSNYSYTVPQYLEWVMQDADAQWTKWFLSVGLREPMLGYQVVQGSDTYKTNCSGGDIVTATYNNAFYCPVDVIYSGGVAYKGVVVLPAVTFQKMWGGNIFSNNSGTTGDFGAGVIAAHEFSHHVTDEIAIQLGQSHPAGKNNELIADCLAGTWAVSLYQRSNLEDGDLNEAANALFAIGDKGSTVSHGTGAERVAALKTGLSGNPFSCFRAYWPQIVR